MSGEKLKLAMPESGDKWPRIARIYFWRNDTLHCVVEVEPTVTPAQVIQIVQVPRDTVVSLKTSASPAVPHGYVLLHLGRRDSPIERFAPIAQVHDDGNAAISIRYTGVAEKIGVLPQPIAATLGAGLIEASRGEISGMSEATPDEGFVTQVYVGSANAPFVELEQLSPLVNAGERASFEIVLSARAAERPR